MARLHLAAHVRNIWRVNAEEGTTMDDVLDPIYWAHTAEKLRIGDQIEVLAEEGTWLAFLHVKSQGIGYAVVALLSHHQFVPEDDETIEQQHSKYEVRWKGPQRKYAVIRKADGQYMREGFDTKQQAFSQLNEMERGAGM